jgi:acetylornithine/succinyldiaminopimelate/putrescine aminotransferase
MEPLMGEGGVHVLDNAFLAEARALATKHGALLIFDEIQSGLGRTGAWFAFERTGVRPDVLILGKPLGGGIPLSALLVNEQLFDSFGVAKHGSTLGGSPMACRLGLEFLSIVDDEGLLQQVSEVGEYLFAGLRELERDSPLAVQARGLGLLLGLELNVPMRPLAEQALAEGFMLNSVQGNVMRFLPSFLLQREHVDSTMELLRRLLKVPAAEEHAEQMAAAAV